MPCGQAVTGVMGAQGFCLAGVDIPPYQRAGLRRQPQPFICFCLEWRFYNMGTVRVEVRQEILVAFPFWRDTMTLDWDLRGEETLYSWLHKPGIS